VNQIVLVDEASFSEYSKMSLLLQWSSQGNMYLVGGSTHWVYSFN